ncbi:hypothetical protein [Nocardioides ultimimeridianus]
MLASIGPIFWLIETIAVIATQTARLDYAASQGGVFTEQSWRSQDAGSIALDAIAVLASFVLTGLWAWRGQQWTKIVISALSGLAGLGAILIVADSSYMPWDRAVDAVGFMILLGVVALMWLPAAYRPASTPQRPVR